MDIFFSGILKIYLKGKSSDHIDNGKYFPYNTIATKNPIIWGKASQYNRNLLPQSISVDLAKSNTAFFLIVKDGKLLHE